MFQKNNAKSRVWRYNIIGGLGAFDERSREGLKISAEATDYIFGSVWNRLWLHLSKVGDMIDKINRLLSIYISILTVLLMVMMAIFLRTSMDIKNLNNKIIDISDGWQYEAKEGAQIIRWEETRNLMNEDRIVLSKRLDEDLIRTKTLIFFETNTRVNASVNGLHIYSKGVDDMKARRWEGTWDWHIVKLPHFVREGDVLEIEIFRTSAKSYGVFPHKIFLSNVDDFFDFILKKSFFAMLICLLSFIFSVMLLCLWIIRRGWKKGHWISLNVSVLALLVTFATLLRIPWVTWVLNDTTVLPIVSMYCGLLAVLPALCFSRRISSAPYTHMYSVLWLFAGFYILLRALLQILGYSDFFLLYPYEQLMIFVMGALYFVLAILDFAQNCREGSPSGNYPVILFWGAALLTDILLVMGSRFYFGNTLFGMASLYGIIYITFSSASSLALTYQDSIDAKKYQLLSETDILTGLKNRNSYTKRIEGLCLKEGLGVIIMDVNNLKSVNDHHGHQEGDRMIVQVSDIITEIFNDEGYESFRIGGDEFAIFVDGHPREDIEKRVWEFESKIRKLNEDRPYVVSVAVGFAVYDPILGGSIDDLVNRADQNMYLKKIAFKL